MGKIITLTSYRSGFELLKGEQNFTLLCNIMKRRDKTFFFHPFKHQTDFMESKTEFRMKVNDARFSCSYYGLRFHA